MMELKYKVWDKKEKIMSDPVHFEWFITGEGQDLEFPKTDESLPLSDFKFHIDDFIIIPYTGRQDKNKNEIYEGDIVHVVYGKGNEFMGKDQNYIDEVYFDKEVGSFMIKRPIGADSLECSGKETIEIVGNMYENPFMINN